MLERTQAYNNNFSYVMRDSRIDLIEQQVNALSIVIGDDELARHIVVSRQVSDAEYAKTYFNREMMAVSA